MSSTENTASIVKKHQRHGKDTGSTEVQVALLTGKIKSLTEHFKAHKLDHHTRRGLLGMVGRRKRLLSYLKGKDVDTYLDLVKKLKIRQ